MPNKAQAPITVSSKRSVSIKTTTSYKQSMTNGGADTGRFLERTPQSPYEIRLTLRFIVLTVFGTAALSFAVGRAAVAIVLLKYYQEPPAAALIVPTDTSLPPPTYSELKDVPHTVYSSKNFDTGVDATSESVLARRAQGFVDRHVQIEPSMTEDLHEPAGQHLLIDIKSVDGAFLNSKDRLASAMINLVNISGLTMLSYHCHALVPVGVSCVGVLLESHISFHTWPIAGVITLDLFTCGPSSLLPLLGTIKELFGVPRQPAVPGATVEKPHMQWVHKKRGFRLHQRNNPEEIDLNQFLLGWFEFDYKEIIVSEETDFQKVEIYDVISRRLRDLESYEKSMSDPDSYEGQNKEIFRPDRVLYLDGIMQSRVYGDAEYHEALVHPVMFSHRNPKRVAIIGGGEGATLREVLKHNTLEKVVMVEIDEQLVNIARKHLPEWNDCSKLVGSPKSCFEHPKAEVYYTDAIAWFMERFGDKETMNPSERFDIIIMDALDPDSFVRFSDVLYDNAKFTSAISNAMTDDGALVAQLGESSLMSDPGATFTKAKYTKIFIDHLHNEGFRKFTAYEEAGCGFLAPWTFMVGFKDWDGFNEWNVNEAFVNKKLKQRAMPTIDGQLPFRFFDGATMIGYQHPTRVMEQEYCRDEPQPEECAALHGYDPERPNAHSSVFQVKQSNIAHAGRGLFTTVDLPKGSTMALEDSVNCMLVMPSTRETIETMSEIESSGRWSPFDPYLFGYGFGSDYFGETVSSIDPGLMTFMNHGCNYTYNLGAELSVSELTADPNRMPDELWNFPSEAKYYSPFYARNYFIGMNLGSTRRDIKAGEEILDNFLNYYTEDNWSRGVLDLRAQCSSDDSLGSVTSYEVNVN